jgi:hypothetical protein
MKTIHRVPLTLALSAIAVVAVVPAHAQQDNCYNEVDDGSGREQCAVVGGGGTPPGGGGTDPRWLYGRSASAQTAEEKSPLIEAIEAAKAGDPR